MKTTFVLISLMQCFLFWTPTAEGIELNLGQITGGLNQGLNNLGQPKPAQKKIKPTIKNELNKQGQPVPVTVLPSIHEVLKLHDTEHLPDAQKERVFKPMPKKKSYLEQVEEDAKDIEPDANEINERRHKAGWAHIDNEDEVIRLNCGGDFNCEKDEKAIMWAAAPTDPTDKSKDKAARKLRNAKRDKLYELAVNKGKARAEKELKKVGGADPYGGVFPPDSFDKEANAGKEKGKEGADAAKGTKTLKGAQKGKVLFLPIDSNGFDF